MSQFDFLFDVGAAIAVQVLIVVVVLACGAIVNRLVYRKG